jgi:hypothetical protein
LHEAGFLAGSKRIGDGFDVAPECAADLFRFIAILSECMVELDDLGCPQRDLVRGPIE